MTSTHYSNTTGRVVVTRITTTQRIVPFSERLFPGGWWDKIHVVDPPSGSGIVRIRFVYGSAAGCMGGPTKALLLEEKIHPELDLFIPRLDFMNWLQEANDTLGECYKYQEWTSVHLLLILTTAALVLSDILDDDDDDEGVSLGEWLLPRLLWAGFLVGTHFLCLRKPRSMLRQAFLDIAPKANARFHETGVEFVAGAPFSRFIGKTDWRPSNYFTYVDVRLPSATIDKTTAAATAFAAFSQATSLVNTIEVDGISPVVEVDHEGFPMLGQPALEPQESKVESQNGHEPSASTSLLADTDDPPPSYSAAMD